MAGNIPRRQGETNLGISWHNDTTRFSNILEDVVFVLSGFVNPERGMLRSQAMKMGAQYQSDWNEDCTLLVCAFSNTPKYMQVKDCCGTIVSKEWILKCYEHKKLVEIDAYLMHAGRPWRRNISQEYIYDGVYKGEHLNGKKIFSPSQVKEWSFLDLDATIFWLESQAEKPDTSEIKSVASEGILTCLQDAIDCIKNRQDMSVMVKEWRFVPRVVKEMVKLEEDTSHLGLAVTRDDMLQQAVICKGVYEMELKSLDIDKGKKMCDSDDETVDMTIEEIEDAHSHLLLFTLS